VSKIVTPEAAKSYGSHKIALPNLKTKLHFSCIIETSPQGPYHSLLLPPDCGHDLLTELSPGTTPPAYDGGWKTDFCQDIFVGA
jgi:hypothetical protein